MLRRFLDADPDTVLFVCVAFTFIVMAALLLSPLLVRPAPNADPDFESLATQVQALDSKIDLLSTAVAREGVTKP